MNFTKFFFFILLMILLVSCSSPSIQVTDDDFVSRIIENYPELNNKTYEVTTIQRVVDGDTYDTDTGQRLRLIGVDTPEVYGASEYYGREASNFSKESLEGHTVYLFKDVGDVDRYQRLLRYVFIDNDPIMFNETLIQEGFASTMTVPPNVTFAERFVSLEREARKLEKGLWGEPNEVMPACADPQIKGNINSSGEKIYHIPSGRYYDITKPEAMFCSEADAVNQGFRKSKQ